MKILSLIEIIEKTSVRLLDHITVNNIMDDFQSAYKAGHSCETALLHVYNDIMLLLLEKAMDLFLFYLIYLLPLTQLIVILCLSCWRCMSESQVMHYS